MRSIQVHADRHFPLYALRQDHGEDPHGEDISGETSAMVAASEMMAPAADDAGERPGAEDRIASDSNDEQRITSPDS